MNNIKFISLRVADFQGIKEERIQFNDGITQITGRNASGKTTIISAVLWLITGKNIDDLADTNFKIQPLTKSNEIILEAKPTVELVVEVNGAKHTIQKTKSFILPKRKELDKSKKYKTKNELIIDGLERKAAQFKTKIEEFFGGDTQFKMFTNVSYFAKKLPWKQQRETLLKYLEPISVQDIFQMAPKFEVLDGLLELPFNDYVQSLRRGINRSNDKMDDNLSRISEQMQTLNNLDVDETIDMEAAKDEEKELEKSILDLKRQRTNRETNFDRKVELEAELNTKQSELDNFEKDFNYDKDYRVKLKESKIASTEREMETNRSTKDAKLQEYHTKAASVENAEVSVKQDIAHDLEVAKSRYELDKGRTEKSYAYNIGKVEKDIEQLENIGYEDACSLCGSPLNEDAVTEHKEKHETKLTELTKSLKDLKSRKNEDFVDLENAYDTKVKMINESINTRLDNRTKTIKNDIENIITSGKKLNTSYEELEGILEKHNSELTELKASVPNQEAINKLKFDIGEIDRKIQELKVGDVDLNELETLEDRIKVVRNTTSNINIIESINTRIDELKTNNKDIQSSVDGNKSKVILCEEFLVFRAALLDKQLRKHFSDDVTFKFYETTQEGGANDVFKILLNGVDYVSVNTAGKIKVGLEIIRFLQANTGIVMPIMIDNREAIDGLYKFPEMKSQLVTCAVSKDNKLTIV